MEDAISNRMECLSFFFFVRVSVCLEIMEPSIRRFLLDPESSVVGAIFLCDKNLQFHKNYFSWFQFSSHNLFISSFFVLFIFISVFSLFAQFGDL